MTHTVTAIPNGKWKQNCYLVVDDQTKLALVIDPGSDAPLILRQLESCALKPVAILNTHAHYDHVGAVSALMGHYGIPFYLNLADAKLLKQANLYKFLFDSKASIVIPTPTHDLACEAGKLQAGGFEVSVLCTPGHTQGSTCLQVGADLFSGDTLLPTGPGRTDLPGGDRAALASSVALLRGLPGSTVVWPGHGASFTLESLWDRPAKARVFN